MCFLCSCLLVLCFVLSSLILSFLSCLLLWVVNYVCIVSWTTILVAHSVPRDVVTSSVEALRRYSHGVDVQKFIILAAPPFVVYQNQRVFAAF